MSRKPRIYCESQMYHVILRGNNRQNIFYDTKDRIFFIKKLNMYSRELDVEIYAYCLMNNHIHILIGKANQSMSKLIQKLATSYAMFFNRKYDHSGHVFQGRYKSEPVETDEYFKTVTRYIIRNSEKADLGKFDQYPWNSYCQTVNKNKSCICKQKLFELFDGKENFIHFIKFNNNDICMEYENKFIFNDSNCLKLIKRILGIKTAFSIIEMAPDEQKNKLSLLKNAGISTNQLSRITGISRKIITEA